MVRLYIAGIALAFIGSGYGYYRYQASTIEELQEKVAVSQADRDTCREELLSNAQITNNKLNIVKTKQENEEKVEDEIKDDGNYKFTASDANNSGGVQ